MTKKVINQSVVFWVAGLVILIDQYTKYLVRSNLAVGEQWMPIEGLAPYFRLLYIENNGAAFGMFQSGGTVFTIVAILVSAVIVYYAARLGDGQWLLRFVLGLQLGGAIGNLIDRLVNGPVTDFFNVLGFLNTPIFNVADLSITTGVILLVLLMWRESREAKSHPHPSEAIRPVDPSS
ncbi:MAG: signal peptidase II [Anaerolineales bacterium]